LRLLLDTHALLWVISAPQRLPTMMRQAVQAAENDVYASLASAWEIGIKVGVGKLVFDVASLEEALVRTGIQTLTVGLDHVAKVARLPHHHRDPFDRMLVAQAMCESMTLVSRDRELAKYGVKLLWEKA
jgi:PIN domain nuclease of toxin-antitoxin system